MTKITPITIAGYRLFHDGIGALSRAELQGMRVDVNYCERKSRHLQRKINRLERKFCSTKFYRHWEHSVKSTPNIHSNAQLGFFLYKIKKLEPAKQTMSGAGSTDEDSLKKLNIPELNDLLYIRKLRKVVSTYLDAFIREQVRGYMHPFFNLNTVKTFRSSCDSPNFQNIPIRDQEFMEICRRAIFPRPGHQLLAVDFGALEVRIAACYHQDPKMIEYIKNPESDMHGDMAQQIFMIDNFNRQLEEHNTLRDAAKNGFVFPQFYGDYYGNNAVALACEWGELPERRWKKGQGIVMPDGSNLSDHLISKGIKSFDSFTEHMKEIEEDFWNVRFPVYKEWKEDWWANYQKRGYIDMFTGFRCSGVMGKNNCINYPVQGTAFHCLLWSLIRMNEIIISKNLQSRIIGQIHDDILFDIYPPELHEVALNVRLVTTGDLPRNFTWINVPLEIDAKLAGVDESWADLKPYKLPRKLHPELEEKQ